ncbi:MAG TPA: carbon storage regulator [Candidatus Anammoximicrobium sp.]|nr:carbon storage regulator [Candidatus Anammoximicrobium sp.]
MLVLSRKCGETIVIDDRIRVTVETVQGGRVRLSIEAPDDIEVDREEIWMRKRLGISPRRDTPAPAASCWAEAN